MRKGENRGAWGVGRGARSLGRGAWRVEREAWPVAVGLLVSLVFLTACEHTTSSGPGDMTPVDSLLALQEAFDDPTACRGCHPNHYEQWQRSMHAYAFVDPVFFTLNDIAQQRSNQQLDQFCVKCHSPIASILKETPPGFDRANLSPIAKKGVQCDVCHTAAAFERGQSIRKFRLDHVKQGPIPDPKQNAFHESEFDNRYNRSQICAPCHDVFSPDGNQIEFTSTEWENSPFSAMGLECQGCHMPTYSGQAAVDGPQRQVHRHTFVGVDIPLVDFPGREQTISEVDNLLKNAASMTVTAPDQIPAQHNFKIDVEISNDITGHNLPSGTVFERQMWIEVIVADGSGIAVFTSGTLDANGDLRNHHSELVNNGTVPVDAALTLFHGIPKRNGQEVLFFWEADFVEDRTIPPFESRSASYTVEGPFALGMLQLSVRLRFRSFPPYFLKEIGEAGLLPNLPIFEMQTYSSQIIVN